MTRNYAGQANVRKLEDGTVALVTVPVDMDGFTPIGNPVTNATFDTAYQLTFPEGATKAMVQIFDKNMRVGFGTNPTASVGFQKTPADGPFYLYKTSDPRLIEEEATATAYIQYGS